VEEGCGVVSQKNKQAQVVIRQNKKGRQREMFEAALKGTKTRKVARAKGSVKGWKTFGGKETNRWKKEGSVTSMMKYKKPKSL